MASVSPRSFSSYLITPTELAEALRQSSMSLKTRIIPVSAAWFLPNDPQHRTGHHSFLSCRLPNARFFDLDAVKDASSPYPHMLPSPEIFAKYMSEMGITRDDEVVVYDTADLGLFSAPRVGWTMKVMGHPKVHVLNNFKRWVEEDHPTESGMLQKWEKTKYDIPKVNVKDAVVDFDEVVQAASKRNAQILDARPEGRWTGEDPEPRPGLSSGHIPNSVSIPYSSLLDSTTMALLPKEELRQLFEAKGVKSGQPVISSCGTGVTAAVIDLALQEAGFGGGRKLYDGSWTEWAQRATEEEGLIVKGT